jgi:hypothetical protein
MYKTIARETQIICESDTCRSLQKVTNHNKSNPAFSVTLLGRGMAWLDTGSPRDRLRALGDELRMTDYGKYLMTLADSETDNN